jgi:autotransporter-associated beta strand protein
MRSSNRSFATDSSSNQTTKHLHDPALPNRTFAIFCAVTILIALALLLAPKARAQTTYTWSTSTTGTQWLNSANWTGGVLNKYPGVDNNTSSTADGSATDIAALGSMAFSGSTLGINMGTSSNSGNGNNTGANGSLTLGAIDYLSTLNKNLVIGDSSATSGTLTLTGATLNGIGNTILSNESSRDVTIQNNGGGSGTLDIALGNSTDNIIQVNGTGDITISSVIKDGAGNKLTKMGTGTLILDAVNTYSGDTTINAGVLLLGNAAGIPSGVGKGNVVIGSGGTLSTGDNNSISINGLFGSGIVQKTKADGTVGGNPDTMTIGNNNANGSFSGVIQDGGGGHELNIIKTGTGTQTFSGNNTYVGTTTVNGGTLEIANSGSTSSGRISGTSGVTVNSGGTLLLSGSSSFSDRINDSATMNLAGGTFNTGGVSEVNGPAGSRTPGIGALTLSANSTIDFGSGSSIIEFAGLGAHTATTGPDLAILNWTGTVNAPGGTDQLLFKGVISDFTGKFSQSDVSFNGVTGYNIFQITTGTNGYYEVTEVPEPSTWVAGALVFATLVISQRRRFNRALTGDSKGDSELSNEAGFRKLTVLDIPYRRLAKCAPSKKIPRPNRNL